MARVAADFAAIDAARRAVRSASDALSTTSLTRPIRRAVCASMSSPVKSICMAALRPTFRDSATMGVEQKRPILTPGVAKRASLAATARSQLATSWQPAAVAMPPTWAMTGFGSWTIARITFAHSAKSC